MAQFLLVPICIQGNGVRDACVRFSSVAVEPITATINAARRRGTSFPNIGLSSFPLLRNLLFVGAGPAKREKSSQWRVRPCSYRSSQVTSTFAS